jgi:hypothetical protein
MGARTLSALSQLLSCVRIVCWLVCYVLLCVADCQVKYDTDVRRQMTTAAVKRQRRCLSIAAIFCVIR